MPDDALPDYQEAAAVLSRSPRAAAGLLRLVVEKVCTQLEPTGKDINTRIGNLVKQGLPTRIQQALDTVRVVGNEAVHPGTMDLEDDQDTCLKLFTLVNIIVQDRITQPKTIEDIFATLPEGKRQGIKDRDADKT
jgi:hypothetical protein